MPQTIVVVFPLQIVSNNLTIRISPENSPTVTTLPLTADNTRSGYYTATTAGGLIGWYSASVHLGSDLLATGWILFNNAAGENYAASERNIGLPGFVGGTSNTEKIVGYLLSLLRTTLPLRRDLIRFSPNPEHGSASELTLVTLFLGGMSPKNTIDQGAGRKSVLLNRIAYVTIRTAGVQSPGNDRTRDIANHFNLETRVLAAMHGAIFPPHMKAVPKLLGGSEDYSTIQERAGGLESQLRFLLEYEETILPLVQA